MGFTNGDGPSFIKSELRIDPDFTVARVDDRLFGSFVEHLGRSIYGGVYEPTHPSADAHGFRTDVLELVKELGVTTIRYPGGNFVSGYRWEDGVGPKESRPRRLDLAWHSTETNQFGLHEMVDWLHELGGNELMEAVNLGTRSLQEALDLLEYTNVSKGTKLSDLRRRNGAEEPFNIKMWCLGNEMDGDWQLGHKSAEDYAKQVALTAAGMRQIDPSIELVACGSSSHDMPEFGTWERTVLEHAYDLIDFVSCHAYYYPHDGDMESFLASAVDMDSFIKDVISNIDAVRSQRHSDHQVNISFDEWNIWYSEAEPSKNPEGIGNWPVAPRLLEDVYTVADAVVFGDLLMTLLKNADRVRSASLAQLVNVIAPIMTEHGGPAWKQTTFFPFALTAAAAKGGTVLEPKTSSDTMPTQRFNDVSAVNSIAVRQPDGSLSVFAVNRSMKNPAEFRIKLPVSLAHTLDSVTASTLNDADINATNTLEHQDRVSMKDNSTVAMNGGGEVTLQLPPVSWTVVSLKKAPTL